MMNSSVIDAAHEIDLKLQEARTLLVGLQAALEKDVGYFEASSYMKAVHAELRSNGVLASVKHALEKEIEARRV